MGDGPQSAGVAASGPGIALSRPIRDLVPATGPEGHTLEQLVRPLLGALADIGQFDSAYLTTIDWGNGDNKTCATPTT